MTALPTTTSPIGKFTDAVVDFVFASLERAIVVGGVQYAGFATQSAEVSAVGSVLSLILTFWMCRKIYVWGSDGKKVINRSTVVGRVIWFSIPLLMIASLLPFVVSQIWIYDVIRALARHGAG